MGCGRRNNDQQIRRFVFNPKQNESVITQLSNICSKFLICDALRNLVLFIQFQKT